MSLIDKTCTELIDLQAKGQASAKEIATAFLAAIQARDPKVKAFMHVDQAAVTAQAAAVDAKRAAKQQLGPLAGVPIAIKDVLCTKGAVTHHLLQQNSGKLRSAV